MRSFLLAFAAAAIWAAGPPNIVLIVSDDHGWRDYGFMGHPHAKTPNIDNLAAESLLFTRGYVPSSLCRPSLASIMTGLYPHQHLITGNDPPGNAKDIQSRAAMVSLFMKSKTIVGELGAACQTAGVSVASGKTPKRSKSASTRSASSRPAAR